MAFTDPNAPVIARQFATDVSPNKRIEMQSNPANIINFFPGIPESIAPGFIKVDGDNAGGAFSLVQMAPPQLTGSNFNANVLTLENGVPPFVPSLKLVFNRVRFVDPVSGNSIVFTPQAGLGDFLDIDKPIKIQGKYAVNTNDAISVDGTPLRLSRGNNSFTVAADGSITIPHNLTVVPQTGFISPTNSSQVATFDIGGSTTTNAKVFIRSITAAGALVAAGTVVAVRYLFTT